MPEQNYYELLQVEPTADSRAIRAAYRRLMLLHHPDRNPGPEAQEMAQRLNHAYEVLRDPQRRADYDWELTGDPGPPPGRAVQDKSGLPLLGLFPRSAWVAGAGAAVAVTVIVVVVIVAAGGGDPSGGGQGVQMVAPISTPNVTPPSSPTGPANDSGGNPGASVVPTATPSASSRFESGEAFIRNGDFAQAIDEFTIAIELIPDYGYGYQVRGDSYFQLAQYELAIEDYDMAIELDLNDKAAYSGRGRAHVRLGQFQSAINDFTKAVELDPRFASAFSRRGLNYAELREFELAKLDTDTACSLDSQYCAPLLSIVPTATPAPTSTPRPAPEATPVFSGVEFFVIVQSEFSMHSDARVIKK